MRNPQFHDTTTDFINSLIRQRQLLIKTGRSKADPGFINDCLWELMKYMSAYKYDTDDKMALFWSKHSSQIYALIPGRDSGTHDSATKLFHALNAKARTLMANPAPWWQPLMTVSPN